jgi:hypothetical protein
VEEPPLYRSRVRITVEDSDRDGRLASAAIVLDTFGLDGLGTPEAIAEYLLDLASDDSRRLLSTTITRTTERPSMAIDLVEIVVSVGAGLLTDAIWRALRAGVADLGQRYRDAWRWSVEALDRDAYVTVARSDLGSRYNTDPGALELLSETRGEHGSWEFRFGERNGRRFEIDFIDRWALARTMRTVAEHRWSNDRESV